MWLWVMGLEEGLFRQPDEYFGIRKVNVHMVKETGKIREVFEGK